MSSNNRAGAHQRYARTNSRSKKWWRFRQRRGRRAELIRAGKPRDTWPPRSGAGAGSWRVDPWRIIEALERRVAWIAICSVGIGILAFIWAYLVQPRTAGVKLVRTVPVGVAALKLDREALQPRQQSFVATLDLLQSPELYRRVAQASLSWTADEVATHRRIHTNSASDPLTLT